MADTQRVSEQNCRYGVFGGTFDPIHTGHLVTAEVVRDAYHLDKVLFIPAANPPHKQGRGVTPAEHRLQMALCATQSNPAFEVLTLEMERPGLSYTIDTIQELLRLYGPQTELYFITGADTIEEIHTWYHIRELLGLCHFVAATRPGSKPDYGAIQREFGAAGQAHIHHLVTPALDISSTDIRHRVQQGLSIKYIVPESVEEYIYREGLYCPEGAEVNEI